MEPWILEPLAYYFSLLMLFHVRNAIHSIIIMSQAFILLSPSMWIFKFCTGKLSSESGLRQKFPLSVVFAPFRTATCCFLWVIVKTFARAENISVIKFSFWRKHIINSLVHRSAFKVHYGSFSKNVSKYVKLASSLRLLNVVEEFYFLV